MWRGGAAFCLSIQTLLRLKRPILKRKTTKTAASYFKFNLFACCLSFNWAWRAALLRMCLNILTRDLSKKSIKLCIRDLQSAPHLQKNKTLQEHEAAASVFPYKLLWAFRAAHRAEQTPRSDLHSSPTEHACNS